jgi:hypothetical protein
VRTVPTSLSSKSLIAASFSLGSLRREIVAAALDKSCCHRRHAGAVGGKAVLIAMTTGFENLDPASMCETRPKLFTDCLHFHYRRLTSPSRVYYAARTSKGHGMRYLFEDFALDTDKRELRQGTDAVALTPQALDVLLYLISNRERVVSKDDLISAVWGGRVISDAAIATRLNAARAAIGDDGDHRQRTGNRSTG